MITAKDISTAINVLLVARFPAYPVYVNLLPMDFSRPSFWLATAKEERKDVNRSTVSAAIYAKVTCLAPVDENGNSDADVLLDLQNTVMNLFRPGYIKVSDRAVKVKASTGGTESDRTFTDLQFEFYDDRTDEADVLPPMGEVHTKLQEG